MFLPIRSLLILLHIKRQESIKCGVELSNRFILYVITTNKAIKILIQFNFSEER